MGGQTVEERVGSGVIALPEIADQRRDRREQHEEIQVHPTCREVQAPGAGQLGREHGEEAIPIDLGDHAVVQSSSGMEHAPQRRPSRLSMKRSTSLDRETSSCTVRISAPADRSSSITACAAAPGA